MVTNLNQTPMANRYHIGIFGNRNAGKSTLMNGITGQSISVVSEVAGTTTDPVYKTMELLPIGPVVFIDTAGYDDEGELGMQRMEKSFEVLRKTDFALVVLRSDMQTAEIKFIKELHKRNLAFLVIINECEQVNSDIIAEVRQNKWNHVIGNVMEQETIDRIKEQIIALYRLEEELSLVHGLINSDDIAVLVTPIDSAAPKGRLILPQQQTIRDILDQDAIAIVTKEHQLKETFASVGKKPKIVITDSQAFSKVSKETPEDILMTSFSILFARQKGELEPMLYGALQAGKLKPSDRVLLVEGCTHHRQSDDIGTVKIPRWIRELAGGEVLFDHVSGVQYPKDLTPYKLIIHCGGCMLNKREIQYRIAEAKEQGVPITNYGMLIAYVMGILERALKPFESAEQLLKENVVNKN